MAASDVNTSLTSDRLHHELIVMAGRAHELDALLSFNHDDALTHAAWLRMNMAQKLAAERFEIFDASDRAAKVLAADDADITKLEAMETVTKAQKREGYDA